MTTVTFRQGALGVIAVLASHGVCSVFYNKFLKKRAAPALTQAETRAIMKGVVEELGSSVRECADLKTEVEKELSKSFGPMPSEAELMRIYVWPTFKKRFRAVQDALLAQHNACEWELEEAVQHYGHAGDQELVSCAEDLTKLLTKMGGSPAGAEEGATAAGGGSGGAAAGGPGMTLVDVIGEIAKRILKATNDYCKAHIEAHGPPTTQEASAQFTAALTHISEEIQSSFLAELGLTKEVWTQLLQQNAHVPEVQQGFMQLTQGIQAILGQYGLQM